MRINKYLAECGVCSRREADRLIEAGEVCINGQRAMIGSQAGEADQITVRGKAIQKQTQKILLAYYKPIGITCTEKDRHAEKTIRDAVSYPIRVTYAGRLDKDSEGLLLLTNDGELIQRMMRAANYHEKEYQVQVNREITEEFLHRMEQGIYLEELKQATRPCEIRKEGKYTFRIILTQGLNRQIRRMCKACGYEVQSLKRIRVMNISLGTLKQGEFREVSAAEQKILYSMAGLLP